MFNLRQRKTDFPKIYFLYRNRHRHYLLFWLEYGADGSIYAWFDDNPDNSWELVAKYSQRERIQGKKNINLEREEYKVFDPHVSWHASGNIHISGYDRKGKKGQRIITDKKSSNKLQISSGITVPFSQIVAPTVNYKNTLRFLGKGFPEEILANNWVGILNSKGFKVTNNGSEGVAFFIIDEKIQKSGKNLTIDLCIHDKKFMPHPPAAPPKSLLYPEVISLRKASTDTAVGIRFFSADVEYSKIKVDTLIATCFNEESVNLIQLRKVKTNSL